MKRLTLQAMQQFVHLVRAIEHRYDDRESHVMKDCL